jgi:SAM-dependent methyltransferase
LDISPKMIEVAQKKYPKKFLKIGSLSEIPFEDSYFENIFCFHVIMHLDEKNLEAFLNEAYKKLAKDGTLIFDFPSKKRRQFLNFKKDGWHGANDFTIEDLKSKSYQNWKIEKYEGVLFFPIHRIPVYFRGFFKTLDSIFCNSFLREYSSYIIVKLRKNDN